jgi:hypothetical protein
MVLGFGLIGGMVVVGEIQERGKKTRISVVHLLGAVASRCVSKSACVLGSAPNVPGMQPNDASVFIFEQEATHGGVLRTWMRPSILRTGLTFCASVH